VLAASQRHPTHGDPRGDRRRREAYL